MKGRPLPKAGIWTSWEKVWLQLTEWHRRLVRVLGQCWPMISREAGNALPRYKETEAGKHPHWGIFEIHWGFCHWELLKLNEKPSVGVLLEVPCRHMVVMRQEQYRNEPEPGRETPSSCSVPPALSTGKRNIMSTVQE